MKNRNRSLDTWKGIAIIAVIGIHACNVAITFPPENQNYGTGLLFRAVFNFAVALFFAISGYFTPSAAEIRERGIIKYYYRRLLPIWIPYLFWTGLYLIIQYKTAHFDLDEIAKALFLGRGIGIGYFVVVLSSLIIIHPFLGRLPRRRALIISTAISALSVAALYWLRIEHPDHRFVKFPSLTSIAFTTWIVFYYLGFYIKTAPPPPHTGCIRKGVVLSAIAISFALSLAESFFISGVIGAPQLAASQVKLSTYFYSVSISIFALHYGTSILDRIRFFAWAGRRSYVLYLCHMLFLGQTMKFLDEFVFIRNNQAIYIPISIAITILSASGCVFISERFLPRQLVYYILGIKKEANKAMPPTPVAVTSRADARAAPSTSVVDL